MMRLRSRLNLGKQKPVVVTTPNQISLDVNGDLVTSPEATAAPRRLERPAPATNDSSSQPNWQALLRSSFDQSSRPQSVAPSLSSQPKVPTTGRGGRQPEALRHLLLTDFSQSERVYLEELRFLSQSVNASLRTLTTDPALMKSFRIIDDLYQACTCFYAQHTGVQAGDWPNVPAGQVLRELLDTVDFRYSEYAHHQFQSIYALQQLKANFFQLQSAINHRSVEQWYKLPVLRVLAYKSFVGTLLETYDVQSEDYDLLYAVAQRLESVLEIAYATDQKVQAIEELCEFQARLDLSQVRDLVTQKRVHQPINLCGPDCISNLRQIVRKECFYDIDYHTTISEKSIRRQIFVVLLTDLILLCQPIPPNKQKGTVAPKFTLLYPPIPLADVSLVDSPNGPKGMGNLMELRIASANLILLQATDPIIKLEWLQYMETVRDPNRQANPDSPGRGIPFPESTLSRASFRKRPVMSGTITTRSRVSFDTVRSTSGDSAISVAPSFIFGQHPAAIQANSLAAGQGMPLPTRAAMPPTQLAGTKRLLKMRRLYVHVWRPNIENHLRWLNQGLMSLEVREDPDSGNPFCIIYPERPSPWDDSIGPLIANLWILASTTVRQQSRTRFFLQNRYCLEFTSEQDAHNVTSFLTGLISRQASRPVTFLAVADTLYSSPRCKVYVLKETGWQSLGGCILEVRKTTAERNTLAVLFEGSCREYLNEWILATTRLKRINSTSTQLALFTSTGLIQLLLRQKAPDATIFNRIMAEQVGEGNVNVAAPAGQPTSVEAAEAMDQFVSCYHPAHAVDEQTLIECESKLYVVHSNEWNSLGLGVMGFSHLPTDQCWRLHFSLQDAWTSTAATVSSNGASSDPPNNMIYNSLVLPDYISYHLDGTRVLITSTIQHQALDAQSSQLSLAAGASTNSSSGRDAASAFTTQSDLDVETSATAAALMIQFKELAHAQAFYQALVQHLGPPPSLNVQSAAAAGLAKHHQAMAVVETPPAAMAPAPQLQYIDKELCDEFASAMDISCA
ncbi:hypothetical protein H4R34_002674 [Dimargaris verticillata]|uniref:DH domain-containing protein n=1 Tax=Dimargaris verticillata TaxID=2761393 RepID=A0A9W8B2C0_9FUNG|nr:hypothetical protein H4R34_002674 [Dimargaris verticillata]